MKRLIALLLAVCLCAGLAACAGQEAQEPAQTPAPAPADTPAADAPAADAPAADTPAADAPADGGDSGYQYKVAFTAISLMSDATINQADKMVEYGRQNGVEVVVYDNKLDGQVAIQNAEIIANSGEFDAVLSFNVDASVSQTIMDIYNAADLPVIAIDIEHPGATFFGADNRRCGELCGEYLGNYIMDNWNGELDKLVLMEQFASGELPRQRVLAATDKISEIVGYDISDRVIDQDANGDASKAQTDMASILQANPDAHHIAVACLTDTYAEGVVAAAETAGRTGDIIMITNNEDVYLEYIKAHPEEDFFGACVAFNFGNYGKWLLPAVKELIEGKDLGEAIYVEHQIVTRENAEAFRAEYE